MKPKQRIAIIIRRLSRLYPNVKTALVYGTPFQLLTSVILSAQCTDKKVNEVTIPMFAKYKTAADFAKIPLPRLAKMIRQTGFYLMKAKAIHATARLVCDNYDGEVPTTMEKLLTLRGVARKTANVVTGELTGKAEGVTVDTHVTRLSNRLGLTKHTNPVKIERDLMKLTPEKEWVRLPHVLVFHGRAVCEAKKPKCNECVLSDICPSAFKFPHFNKRPGTVKQSVRNSH